MRPWRWASSRTRRYPALSAPPVVHENHGSLNLPETRESSVEQLVGDPGAKILNPQGSLVGGKSNFHGAPVKHLTVELALGFLRVFAEVHPQEREVLLGVEKQLPTSPNLAS